jgi:aromatic-L-amino-acid/L-tryptophan decarboxylase
VEPAAGDGGDDTIRRESGRPDRLDEEQLSGMTDMTPADFRAAAHQVADMMADYLETVGSRAVFPAIEPGALRPQFPAAPPETPDPLADILADYGRLIEPNATHWQHPGFLAYFATTASGPGILGEMLTATIGQNPMLWRTSPIGTELEEVVVDWLRQGLGLPADFDGLLTDTASTSSLIALAGARQAAGLDAAAMGLTGRADVPGLRIYASAEAHSSIDKACMTLGLGRTAVVRIPTNDRFELRPSELAEAIAADRLAGHRPIAVVATVGTTSSTSVDPVAAVADITEREGLWLHVDAAYAGAVALLPDRRGPFAGWERADSIVINPHKWLFTPLDASLLLTRRMPVLRDAFSLVPEYLRTLDRATPVHDYNEYTPQLGRRFRALKLWIHLRWFGMDGLRRRIERHIELAQRFAEWVDRDPDWERLAPVPFSTVCFRWAPRAGGLDESTLDQRNAAIMDAVNRTGEVFLSHTRLDGRFTIRVAIGNLRTEERHVERTWVLLREAAGRLMEAPTG